MKHLKEFLKEDTEHGILFILLVVITVLAVIDYFFWGIL